MSTILRLMMAGAIALAPAVSLAGPGSPNGPANGWDHLKGPDPSQLGQPGAECGSAEAAVWMAFRMITRRRKPPGAIPSRMNAR